MADLPELLFYSARFLEPFLRVLHAEGRVAAEALNAVLGVDPDQRIPIESAHAFLALAGPDDTLGLKASRNITLGDVGAYDYAMSTAATLRDALQVASRFARLVNDAASWSLFVESGLAIARVRNHLPLPRVALDFQLGAFLRNHTGLWPSGLIDELEIHLPYPAPSDLAEHHLTFGSARLLFATPHLGFAFPARYLEHPLSSTDARLHRVLRSHAEFILSSLPRAQSLSDRVRAMLLEELSGGDPSAERVAKRLYMSRRTLVRRLDVEGTTFNSLSDELRRELAVNYLWSTDLSIAEVALLTGFSSSTAFHRAFRRWTGGTPRDFRVARRERTSIFPARWDVRAESAPQRRD